MRPQAFQAGEVRDEHDNIIRAGAYGKKSPFTNANNAGILDYIINNFDVVKGLLDAIEAEKLKGIATQAEAEAGTVNDKIMTPLRVKQVADKYLPLSGGTMNGPIKSNQTHFFIRNESNGGRIVLFGGGEYRKGGSLYLYNAKYSVDGGAFQLCAHDGTNESILHGSPWGVLRWRGKEIERIEAKGDNYVRYSNGLQICWYRLSGITTSVGEFTWTFPLPFVQNVLPSLTHSGWYALDGNYFFSPAAGANYGNAVVFNWNNKSTNSSVFFLTAIGKWK